MRFFLLDHFSRHPWGCVEALKPFLGPFFPRKLLINMLVTLIGENSASESVEQFSKKFVFPSNFAIFADSAHTVRLRDPELILLSSVDQYASFGTLQVKSTVKLRIFIFLVF